MKYSNYQKSQYWFEIILNKLENRYAKFAVKNLISYIVALNAFVYILSYLKPEYINLLTLNINKVFQGQFWRIFTYLFIPPFADPIFIFFALYLLYLFGTALEGYWGAFRLNIYYLLGLITTTIIGFIFPNSHITNIYINTSVFLAFSAVYPDFRLYLFFILPVKVKYLAIFTWIGISVSILFGFWSSKLAALVSVLNFVLFFWPQIVQNALLMRSRSKASQDTALAQELPFHKCSICKKTEHDDSNLEFRVCTICSEEFCMEHLREHKH